MSQPTTPHQITLLETPAEVGSFDEEATRRFCGELLERASRVDPPWVIVDLTHTTYIGSHFLESLVRAWKRLKARDGRLVLCGLRSMVLEVMQIARLDTLWEIYDNRQQAIAEMTRPPE